MQSRLVTSFVHTADMDKTRHDKTVLFPESGGIYDNVWRLQLAAVVRLEHE